MEVDLDVPFRDHGEVEEPVPGKQGEHVVKKRNPGPDIGSTRSIERKGEGNVGLSGLAVDSRSAGCRAHGFGCSCWA